MSDIANIKKSKTEEIKLRSAVVDIVHDHLSALLAAAMVGALLAKFAF